MKNYETGICDVCGERKEAIYHITHDSSRFPLNLPPHDFKDSGLAQLEKNAPKLLIELQKAKEIIEILYEYIGCDLSTGSAAKQLSEINQAINEALKRE